jgi:hypothetical protein
MAWQDSMIPMVRLLIADTSDVQRYDDDRIAQALVTAGLIVSQEIDLDADYVFDLTTPDIIPDPTVINDNAAIALFGLKAACLFSMNDYQKAVGAGIRVRDGDSEVDTTGRFKGYSDIINIGPCASYTKLLQNLLVKNSMGVGGAVMSPYSSGTVTWGNYTTNGSWNISRFYNDWLYW